MWWIVILISQFFFLYNKGRIQLEQEIFLDPELYRIRGKSLRIPNTIIYEDLTNILL